MKRIKTCIFDLGNVLVFHDNALMFQRLGEVAAPSIPASEVQHRLLSNPLWDAANRGELEGPGIYREIQQVLGLAIDFEGFKRVWSCHFSLNLPMLREVELLLEVGEVKVLLLSNTNVLHLDYLLPRLPLLGRFEHRIFSNQVGLVKPNPEIFKLALRKAGADPQATLFVDDVEEYVGAARALGIQAHRFDPLQTAEAQVKKWMTVGDKLAGH